MSEGFHSINEDMTQGNVCPPASVNIPEIQIKQAYFSGAVADASGSSHYRLLKQQQATSSFNGHVLKLARELYFNHGSCLTVAELCNISALQHRSYYLFTPPPPSVHCRDQKLFEAAHHSAT